MCCTNLTKGDPWKPTFHEFYCINSLKNRLALNKHPCSAILNFDNIDLRANMFFVLLDKAMPNRNSVKRPRARSFKSPQSNKKNKFVGEMFLNNSDVPGFRKNITIL